MLTESRDLLQVIKNTLHVPIIKKEINESQNCTTKEMAELKSLEKRFKETLASVHWLGYQGSWTM